MPKIITEEFATTSYKVPYPGGNADEFVLVKPLSSSRVRAIAAEVQAADMPDADKAREFEIRLTAESIRAWNGFVDPSGKGLGYSSQALRFIAEPQPEVYSMIGKLIASAVATGKPVKE